jgi:hypothetical protein
MPSNGRAAVCELSCDAVRLTCSHQLSIYPHPGMNACSHTVAAQDEVDAHLSRGVELALASSASGAGGDGRGRLVMIDTAEGYGSSEEKVSSVARTRMHPQPARTTPEHARTRTPGWQTCAVN